MSMKERFADLGLDHCYTGQILNQVTSLFVRRVQLVTNPNKAPNRLSDDELGVCRDLPFSRIPFSVVESLASTLCGYLL